MSSSKKRTKNVALVPLVTQSLVPFLAKAKLDRDIEPYPGARFKIRLVVFDGLRSMSAYGRSLGAQMFDGDNAFVYTGTGFYPATRNQPRQFYADSKYFCVMVFHVGALSLELIAHESVHAGFAIAKRRVRDPWRHLFKDPEEWVAYPAGRIMEAVTNEMRKSGLYRG